MQGLLIYIFHSHTHTHPCVLCVYNVYVSILWRGSREYIVALAHHKYLLDYSRGPFFFRFSLFDPLHDGVSLSGNKHFKAARLSRSLLRSDQWLALFAPFHGIPECMAVPWILYPSVFFLF